MQDTIIKKDGTSRFLKTPANMPTTYDAWRAQLLAGTATMDIGLNPDGCTVVGTPLNKANLLTDTTKTALELTGDATVNEALYALRKKIPSAVLNVHTEAGVVVTATKDSRSFNATANSDGIAVLYPDEIGTWLLSATINEKAIVLPYNITAIATFDVSMVTSLEDASWALISANAEAGTAATIWSVGDTKTIQVGSESYIAQIIGFEHDTKTAGGKAGITFQLVNCTNTRAYIDGVSMYTGGWKDSDMRTTTMAAYFNSLSEDLKTVIKPVNKQTSADYQATTLDITSERLFLLSEVEIMGSAIHSASSSEGKQYAWYAAGNSKLKKVNDSIDYWWTRSHDNEASRKFCAVNKSASTSTFGADITNEYGVSFAFCV